MGTIPHLTPRGSRLEHHPAKAGKRQESGANRIRSGISFITAIDLPPEAIEDHLLRQVIYQLDKEAARYRSYLRAIKAQKLDKPAHAVV